MDTKQEKRFRQAVDRKKEEAEAASKHPTQQNPREPQIHGDQPQDAVSVRDKSSGHGHKTADKWNQ